VESDEGQLHRSVTRYGLDAHSGGLARVFVNHVFANYRARAKRVGIERGECGAITFVQRFGGSLNLNVHFHTVFIDGIFTRDGSGRVRFRPASAPEAAELQTIARRVHRAAMAWLQRHGHVDERPPEARSGDIPEPPALDACATIAIQRGAFAKLATGAASACFAMGRVRRWLSIGSGGSQTAASRTG
jgi:hypothetical protein